MAERSHARAADAAAAKRETLARRSGVRVADVAGPAAARALPSLSRVPAHAPPLLGSAADAREAEADRAAARIADGRAASIGSGAPETAATPLPAAVEQRLGRPGAGSTMDGGLRSRLEPLLGGSLDGVRIHTGLDADQMARRLDADAFTLGQHVFFRDGTFAPERRDGLQLLAHELAHTRQARAGGPPRVRAQTTQPKPAKKVARLVRVVVYRDLNQVAIRLDDGTTFGGTLTYNGRPKPGAYSMSSPGQGWTADRLDGTP